jgi:hypothetical protein
MWYAEGSMVKVFTQFKDKFSTAPRAIPLSGIYFLFHLLIDKVYL